MARETLTLTHDGPVATITFNRPAKRNAISPQMIGELQGALDEVESGNSRVAIITGEGKAFCAGMDLEALRALTAAGGASSALEDSRRIASLFRRIDAFPKPLIAAVNGPAIAGGCGIATLCDFTLAAREASFGYTEVRIGFVPALVSVFLIRQIGEKRARDLLLTGRVIDAEEAYRLGLVNEVLPAKELMPRARLLASQLLSASPTSLATTKRLLVEFEEPQLERRQNIAIAANANIRATEDFKEGIAAFLEKRKPRWHSD